MTPAELKAIFFGPLPKSEKLAAKKRRSSRKGGRAAKAHLWRKFGGTGFTTLKRLKGDPLPLPQPKGFYHE